MVGCKGVEPLFDAYQASVLTVGRTSHTFGGYSGSRTHNTRFTTSFLMDNRILYPYLITYLRQKDSRYLYSNFDMASEPIGNITSHHESVIWWIPTGFEPDYFPPIAQLFHRTGCGTHGWNEQNSISNWIVCTHMEHS